MPTDRLDMTAVAHVKAIRDGLPPVLEWTERDLSLLELAERQAADLDELEADIADKGIRISDVKLNPAVMEARQARIALGRLLGLVDIPTEASTHSIHASKAAKERWAS